MNRDNILFISNGYGEDTIACSIIERLKKLLSKDEIIAFPLVGEGVPYNNHNVPVIAPIQNMPSGGLFPEGYIKNLWTDLNSGLAALTLRQIKTLCKYRENLKAVVAVGDTLPVLMGGIFTKMPIIFVGTAKSDYFDPYSSIEKAIYKKYCIKVFPRDEKTARSLVKSGVRAKWVGNAMMDSLELTSNRFGIPRDIKVVTLLPGSRDFAYKDFPVILKAVDKLDCEFCNDLRYIAPLAGSINLDELGRCAESAGFSIKKTGNEKEVIGILQKGSKQVFLIKGFFGTAINMADIVIGQAGTGNEQAVGLGKPVVSFDSGGKKKLGWYRARQKGLLGDSLAVVSRDADSVVKKTLEILRNSEVYKHMARVGRERLGPSGGAEKMANFIYEYVSLLKK